MLYSALMCVLQETTAGVKNFLRSREGGCIWGRGSRLRSFSWWLRRRGKESPGFDDETEGRRKRQRSCTRNKDGTISRMRSTSSTNAGSQAVKQIRPSYIYTGCPGNTASMRPPPPCLEEECCRSRPRYRYEWR